MANEGLELGGDYGHIGRLFADDGKRVKRRKKKPSRAARKGRHILADLDTPEKRRAYVYHVRMLQVVAVPEDGQWRIYLESPAGRNPIGTRMVKTKGDLPGSPGPELAPKLDWYFPTEEAALARADEWHKYIIVHWSLVSAARGVVDDLAVDPGELFD